MIAMALSCKPQLLIADEPTTALDVTIQAQILQLIRQLQEEMDMGVIFITHDMGVVAEVADRVLVMYRGDKVEEGGSDAVRPAAARLHARALLAVPRLGPCTARTSPRHFRCCAWTTRSRARRKRRLQPRPCRPALDRAARERPGAEGARPTTTFDITGGILGRVQKRVHAVEKVSFDLYPGETLSLVGESGCGKTTTGRSLLQLVKSRAGTIEFDGKNIGDCAAAPCRRCRTSSSSSRTPSPRWIRA